MLHGDVLQRRLQCLRRGPVRQARLTEPSFRRLHGLLLGPLLLQDGVAPLLQRHQGLVSRRVGVRPASAREVAARGDQILCLPDRLPQLLVWCLHALLGLRLHHELAQGTVRLLSPLVEGAPVSGTLPQFRSGLCEAARRDVRARHGLGVRQAAQRVLVGLRLLLAQRGIFRLLGKLRDLVDELVVGILELLQVCKVRGVCFCQNPDKVAHPDLSCLRRGAQLGPLFLFSQCREELFRPAVFGGGPIWQPDLLAARNCSRESLDIFLADRLL
mmetsp:Transcript_8263/g.24515  ORF Transcript_8263/g.24515 Transcript_8263/m.24515 type:complete len:272 (-) Transcript_8263:111-926(-)